MRKNKQFPLLIQYVRLLCLSWHRRLMVFALVVFVFWLPGAVVQVVGVSRAGFGDETVREWPLVAEIEPADYPIQTGCERLEIGADSYIILDMDSFVPILEHNADKRRLPASTTKIMTGLVTLENLDLGKVVRITDEDVVGQTMGLVLNEEITVQNLLFGLLVKSGNDAALALSRAFEGGYMGMVERMNKRAVELGLENSHFMNVSGIDSIDHYMSARDLARLAVFALENPVFSRIVSTNKIIVHDVTGLIAHDLVNTNLLLDNGVDGVMGVKTGWTQGAGECLVLYVNKATRRLMVVVMGSNDRFREAERLVDWAFDCVVWQKPLLF